MQSRSKLQFLREILSEMTLQERDLISSWTSSFISSVEQHGEGMSREMYWQLLDQVKGPSMFGKDVMYPPEYMAWNQFIQKARNMAGSAEFWSSDETEPMPRIRTAVEIEGGLVASDLVCLGGEPDWIHDEEIPRCPECRFAMHLFVQVKSPSSVELGSVPELQELEQSDSGTTYVFRCYSCSRYEVMEQCY